MLTQAEIDALLSGALQIDQSDGSTGVNLADLMGQPGAASQPAASGFPTAGGMPGAGKAHAEEGAGKIQAYNFWSPDRFSKEQMRAVELVHEDLAERLTTSLPTFLRTNLRPRLVHTEQGRFHDFLKDFPVNSLFYLMSLAPLPGQMVLTLSPNVNYIVLEQRLGGRNEGKFFDRILTDIDQALLRGLVEHMLGDIKAAWSKVVSIEPTLEDITTNQHWVQMILGNDRAMLLTFEINIQSVTGTMSIFVPFNLLKPIANELNPHLWITGRKEQQSDNSARQAAMKNLYDIGLQTRVVLGEINLPLSEILRLQPGDIIRLDTALDQELKMAVGNQTRFTVKSGKVGKQMACQVTGVIHDSDTPQR